MAQCKATDAKKRGELASQAESGANLPADLMAWQENNNYECDARRGHEIGARPEPHIRLFAFRSDCFHYLPVSVASAHGIALPLPLSPSRLSVC